MNRFERRRKDAEIRARIRSGDLSPADVCRAALKSVGVPDEIVDKLEPGRRMDCWVQYAVMEKKPWAEVNVLMQNFE